MKKSDQDLVAILTLLEAMVATVVAASTTRTSRGNSKISKNSTDYLDAKFLSIQKLAIC
jgi:hypothetical protein